MGDVYAKAFIAPGGADGRRFRARYHQAYFAAACESAMCAPVAGEMNRRRLARRRSLHMPFTNFISLINTSNVPAPEWPGAGFLRAAATISIEIIIATAQHA